MRQQIHTLIVPGVSGSDEQHWQSKLEEKITHVSRVKQEWNLPILQSWIQNFVNSIEAIDIPIQIVAHSFGCLTTIAALSEYPHLHSKIKKMILVAPANPARFSKFGFSHGQHDNYSTYFKNIKLKIAGIMLISENDPWLNQADAEKLAQDWHLPTQNLGQVGHINVASGFGHFPQLTPHLLQQPFIPMQKQCYFYKNSPFFVSTCL